MATMRTKGKVMIGPQVDAELWAKFKAYIAERGETQTVAIERALAREMAYPPPPPVVPPLTPLPDAAPGGATTSGKTVRTRPKRRQVE